MEEIWKDKKDYEGHYQVSNFGRVKSIKFGKEIILKQHINKGGYYYVCLLKNGKHKNYYVHRLVAEAFIDNPDNLPQVNHKDENKTNNSVDNLERCTNEYNHNYGTINERISQSQSKPVLQYDLNGNLIKEWKSINECGRNGFNQGDICKCCNGKRKTAKGFICVYKNEADNYIFLINLSILTCFLLFIIFR